MTRSLRLIGLCIVAVLACPAMLWAQFPSELVGFNGPPIGVVETSQEMFRLFYLRVVAERWQDIKPRRDQMLWVGSVRRNDAFVFEDQGNAY